MFFGPPGFFSPPRFFSPPGFFSPPRFCIEQSTNVLTSEGYKKAQDVQVGDIIITKIFDDLPIGDFDTISSWFALDMSNINTQESEVTEIVVTPQSRSITINGDINKRFSLKEDILICRAGEYCFVNADKLTSSDQLVTYDENNNVVLTDISTTTIINEDTMVYDFIREPFGLIVADSLIVYNAYPNNE